MADGATSNEGLKELLKPFYQRASAAEDRLSRLETVVSTKKVNVEPGNEESSNRVKELELKLEQVTSELAAEKEKVANLTADNNKKEYRIIQLVRSIREVDLKLQKLSTS